MTPLWGQSGGLAGLLKRATLYVNFAGGTYYNVAGYVRTNYFLNASAPATQTIALAVGSYTLNITGSGSAAVAAGTATITGAGTATAGAWVKFTVTVAGTITVTITGSPTTVQVGNGNYPTTFINTGAAAVTVTTYASSNPADVGNLIYTRAGTAYSLDGTIAFADNVPRIVPGQGYLAEPSATNLATNSQAFDLWGQSNTATLANQTTAPDGTATADFLRPDTSNSLHRINWTPTGLTVSQPYTFSVFAKAGGYRYLLFNSGAQINATAVFDLQAGTVLTASGTAKIEPSANGFYICTVYGSAVNASSTVYLQVNNSYVASDTAFAADGVSGIYVWQADFVAGTTRVSPIPTTTAPVTRPADVGYYTLSSSLSTAYSLAAVGQSNAGSGGFSWLAQLDDGSSANRTILYLSVGASTSAPTLSVDSGSVNQVFLASSAVANGTSVGIAASIQSSRMATSANGGAILAGTGTVPTVSILRLGSSSSAGNILNGTLKSAAVYSSALSDSQTEFLSSSVF